MKIGNTPIKVFITFGKAYLRVFEMNEYSGEYSKYYTKAIQDNIQPKPQSTSENMSPV